MRSSSNTWRTTTSRDLSAATRSRTPSPTTSARRTRDLKGQMVSQGTTPRRLTDLIGSLCRPDLRLAATREPPSSLIQGYFDNYTK